MATDTKNVIFKIFIIIIVLIIAYYAYREIKRLMVAKKTEQRIEKVDEKVSDLITSMKNSTNQEAS
ncbi:MAG: hypothetical protein WCD44_03815 [Candidatus Babeliales bacterium]